MIPKGEKGKEKIKKIESRNALKRAENKEEYGKVKGKK